MKNYPPEVFQQLVAFIKEDERAGEWLVNNGYPELLHFWDACERVEKSFKWLLENDQRPLAATVDAMTGNDKAKVWLITSGYRELAAFTDACDGKQSAVTWLLKFDLKGWVQVAREIYLRNKKKDKSAGVGF